MWTTFFYKICWVRLTNESFLAALGWLVLAFGHQFTKQAWPLLSISFLAKQIYSWLTHGVPTLFICEIPGWLARNPGGGVHQRFVLDQYVLQRKSLLHQVPPLKPLCCIGLTRAIFVPSKWKSQWKYAETDLITVLINSMYLIKIIKHIWTHTYWNHQLKSRWKWVLLMK